MKLNSWKSVVVIGSLASTFLFSIGFKLVVVRNDIASDAKHVAELEYKLMKAQDVLRAVEVKVDDSVQPHVLKRRVQSFLDVPSEGQVVRVLRSDVESLGSATLEVLLNGREDV